MRWAAFFKAFYDLRPLSWRTWSFPRHFSFRRGWLKMNPSGIPAVHLVYKMLAQGTIVLRRVNWNSIIVASLIEELVVVVVVVIVVSSTEQHPVTVEQAVLILSRLAVLSCIFMTSSVHRRAVMGCSEGPYNCHFHSRVHRSQRPIHFGPKHRPVTLSQSGPTHPLDLHSTPLQPPRCGMQSSPPHIVITHVGPQQIPSRQSSPKQPNLIQK
ncbi:uncharacterized protein PADG_11721 [Paracoccidioides brasiliensis Pb18]|uniref:Uncharacterized protein n=1 Tax=Paracoccidioides brasiliensis (strain Pb18) TaxID=502780 RepID=A0A0A0HV22_PARBD|nr:uncharacterized protein PADG_11721 [Paracoccidioides brasiliensis Pb18]KGM92183.1 hypothetical protein PADG_11721 [Paracoccidioides brasiliensis Pb18]